MKCIHKLFDIQAQKTPDAIAVTHHNNSLTYKKLQKKSNKLANYLVKRGVGKDVLVGICLERSTNMVLSVLAVLKAGGAYLPLDPSYPRNRLQTMISDSRCQYILTSNELKEIVPAGDRQVYCLDTKLHEINKEDDGELITTAQIDNLAYCIYTSGSTGAPKGIAMSHKPLANLITWQIENCHQATELKTLQFSPLSFDVSFQEIFSTWCGGGTLVIIDEELRLDASLLLQFIQSNGIERLFLPFIALQHLTETAVSEDIIPTTLKEIITAGEQLQITTSLMAFFGKSQNCTLYNQYGPSETHVVSSYKLTGTPTTWPTLPPIGHSIDNVELFILDDEMNPVRSGQTGELYVGGVGLAREYIHNKSATEKKFIANSFSSNSNERLYKTGDLAQLNKDGEIEFLGRIDDQVKVRGYRIEVGEIEVAISKHPSVVQAIVSTWEPDPGNKVLVAYIIYRSQQESAPDTIRNYLKQELPDYMVPSYYHQVETFPRTPSGKVDRSGLPKPTQQRPELSSTFAPPVHDLEKRIAKIWARFLPFENIGIDDNFFDLGGTSITATKVISDIRKAVENNIPVFRLFQYPTIRGFSAHLLENTVGRRNQQVSNNNTTVKEIRDSSSDPIAVVGMSCRVPGADSTVEFWNNLCQGNDSISHFREEDLKDWLPQSLLERTEYIKARGIINRSDHFDASFFKISRREAEIMDPQQRVLLETAWAALEDAAVIPEEYTGSIGVYVGKSNNTYFSNNLHHNPDAIAHFGDFQAMLLNEKDYLATHIAHKLNLTGPAISVNTACSTSLVAITQAFNGLNSFQCDLALAGGVTITSPIKSGYLYQEGGIYSPDGRTRPFDEQAQGTVFSDGAGIVVLKRLNDALKDGNRIYAVVKGVGINNDGSDKASFSAPSVFGQAQAITKALHSGDIEPGSISYVETHGTATPLGDPIEIEALKRALGIKSPFKKSCALGSVKGNIGHLNAASGVIGFIKTVLCLKHKQLPPTLYFNKLNPEIDLEDSPIYVNTSLQNWDHSPTPRRAGVSSFGVGGTNAHVILEEAPEKSAADSIRKEQLLMLSARTQEGLTRQISHLHHTLESQSEISLADVSYTLQTGRKAFEYRYYTICSSHKEALASLQKIPAKNSKRLTTKRKENDIAFVFPGQGTQHLQMGHSLFDNEPVFRATIDFCAKFLQPILQLDLRELLYGSNTDEKAEELLNNTLYAQPALFMVELALAHQWIHWGIAPAAMVGHSIGEYVAACLAEVFSITDALSLVAERGRLMQELPPGQMLSVLLSEKAILPLLNGKINLAAINSPTNVVVSGPADDINTLDNHLNQQGVSCRLLNTSHAFHSSMMEPAVTPFREAVRQIKLSEPTIPFVSTVTGNWVDSEAVTKPEYWSEQLRATVRFSDAIALLWREKNRLLLEVGPRSTSTTLARQQVKAERKSSAISTMGPSHLEEGRDIISAIGQLWLHGISIDWINYYDKENRQHLSLPTYPFSGERYWLDPKGQQASLNRHKPIKADCKITTESKKTTMIDQKKQYIFKQLQDLFVELSGEDISKDDENITFIELGFDSLLLTQASIQINNAFKVSIKFRQLLEELSTLALLTGHLSEVIPEDQLSIPVEPMITDLQTPGRLEKKSGPTPKMINVASSHMQNQPGSIEEVINKQLEIMANQVQLLREKGYAEQDTPGAFDIQSSKQPQPSSTFSPASSTGRESNTSIKKPFGASARITRTEKSAMDSQMAKAFEDFSQKYVQKTLNSKQRTQETRAILADPRVVSGFRPEFKEVIYPIIVNESKGSKLIDIDGNTYIDLTCGFGSNLLGYSQDFVNTAITEQLAKGIEIGPQHPLTSEVSQLLLEFTKQERVAFCNTGSEAVLGAMRLARTITGKNLIAIFKGAYHGIFDEVIVRTGKNNAPVPAAPGIPQSMVKNLIVVDYDTPDSLALLEKHSEELAAVLVEPVQSRNPALQPREFLHKLREITAASGAALIFDEVITGFRIHPGGAQAYFGVQADIATYGKVIGGGLPIGVIAGKKKFMDGLDGGSWCYGDDTIPEVGVTYFAGTFVRHPLALAAAKAVLNHLKEAGPSLQENLNSKTDLFREELNNYFVQYNLPLKISNFGSLFKISIDEDLEYSELFFIWLRYKGIHIWDARPCFFTTSHTDADIKNVIEAIKQSVKEMQDAGFLPGASAKLPTYSPNNENSHAVPPINGARLGKDKDGNPSWFVSEPDNPDKYQQVEKENQTGDIMSPKVNSVTKSVDYNPFADGDLITAIPATESQKEIWLSAKMGPEANCAFNESVTIELRGDFHENHLRTAFDELTTHHDALRASFSPDGNTLCIAEPKELFIETHDLSSFQLEEAEKKFDVLVQQDLASPFELPHGPLLRTTIIKIAPSIHKIVITCHHIICDGWSLSIILRELGQIYTALCSDSPIHLKPAFPFSQYAINRQHYYSTEENKISEQYWIEQFQDHTPVLDLPVNRTRPPLRTYTSKRKDGIIPQEVLGKLQQVSNSEGVSLFTTLFAGFSIYVHRITNQEDFVIGVPASGQIAAGQHGLVGHCVHLLPIRLSISAKKPFTEILQYIKEPILNAFDNQEYTFGSLISKLKIDRDPSRIPLVSLTFNVDPEFNTSKLVFDDAEVQVDTNPRQYENFEMSFNLVQLQDGMRIECQYNIDLFMSDYIEQRLIELTTLYDRLASSPDKRISEIPLLTTEEHNKVVELWNRTEMELPIAPNLYDLIKQQGEDSPTSPAIKYKDQEVSYQDLLMRTEALASYLQSSGIESNTPVAIYMDRSIDMVVGVLGVLAAGGTYIPIDPGYPVERIHYMLEDSQTQVILSHSSLAPEDKFQKVQIINIDTEWEQINHLSTTLPRNTQNRSPEDTAYIIYTSGSTGKPKGVQVPHRSVINFLYSMKQTPGCSEEDTLLAVTTLSFDISVLEIFLPLICGAKIVIADQEAVTNGLRLKKLLEEEHITIMQGTPSTWRLLLAAGWDGNKDTTILCGGEPLPLNLVQKLTGKVKAFWNLYGPTETTVWSLAYQIDSKNPSKILIGHPIANTSVYVLDTYGHPLPIGIPGELFIGGKGVTHGYLNKDELTSKQFIDNPFTNSTAEKLYRTGDFVKYHIDGNIEYIKRKDKQIKIRGFRIELGEIETVVNSHPVVDRGVLSTVELQPGDTRLVAYVVLHQGETLTISDIREYMRQRLPEYMIPQHLVEMEKLALTPAGKIDRKALPQPFNLAASNLEYQPPETETELALANIWQEFLHTEKVDVHDNFFEIGGHSLMVMEVIMRLKKEFNRELEPKLFLLHSLKQLAAQLEETKTPTNDHDKVNAKEQWSFSKKIFGRIAGAFTTAS